MSAARRRMRVLMAASECVPFCKTGGLADVVGALPRALKARGVEVRVVLPKYRAVDERLFRLKKTRHALRLPLGGSTEVAALWQGELAPGIPAYFIDIPRSFDREGLYAGPDGRDFPDNDARFILFSRAVLEAARAVRFRPDVVHCHDWQTGLVPAYLATLYAPDAFFRPTAPVFTVHNAAYQGVFPMQTMALAGLSWDLFTPERLEYYNQMSFLKAGVVFSAFISTVSPTYAREIRESSEFGRGLEGLYRTRGENLLGILNGLDTRTWDPARDLWLAARYSALRPAGKSRCKQALERELGFREHPSAPLLGVVSRLDPQKGLDLIAEAADELLGMGARLAVLGEGDPGLKHLFTEAARRHPGRLRMETGFNDGLAHRIYAGSDLFLMPSRFEPCGLGQMISMRYGTVPVVTRRGGLADTVCPLAGSGDRGTGFVMDSPTPAAFRRTMRAALDAFGDAKAWGTTVRRIMRQDFSWSEPVRGYLRLYRLAADRRRNGPPL